MNVAIYRYPNQDVFHCIVGDGTSQEQRNFIMHSFAGDRHVGIAGRHLQSDDLSVVKMWIQSYFSENCPLRGEISSTTYADYCLQFSVMQQALQTGLVQKVVLAKRKVVEYGASLEQIFLKALQSYAHAFCYLSLIDGQMWLGCTPELLLSAVKNGSSYNYETMSLAGTRSVQFADEPWSTKNIGEQQVVTNFITQSLLQQGVLPSASLPYTVTTAEIQHLRSDISFSSNLAPQNIACVLSPTPAVCGMPKQPALQLITQTEHADREFYAGIVGVETDEESRLYVNIRSCRLFDGRAVLFLGSGIMPQSTADDEWQETELKARTIERILSL